MVEGNHALMGELSSREISCIVEKLEKIENNVKSLSCIEEGSVYFEREIAKLNRNIVSTSNLEDQDQKIEERFEQYEAELNARFEQYEAEGYGFSPSKVMQRVCDDRTSTYFRIVSACMRTNHESMSSGIFLPPSFLNILLCLCLCLCLYLCLCLC
jgi:hypothetical protein